VATRAKAAQYSQSGSFGTVGYSVRSNKGIYAACESFFECLRKVAQAAAEVDHGLAGIPDTYTHRRISGFSTARVHGEFI
jgi:hypothetical protein